jgi:hypothetical protein
MAFASIATSRWAPQSSGIISCRAMLKDLTTLTTG